MHYREHIQKLDERLKIAPAKKNVYSLSVCPFCISIKCQTQRTKS